MPLVTLLVPCLQGMKPLVAFLPVYKDPKIPSWPGLPYLQGIQPLVALLVAGLQGIKPLEAFFAMSLGHTIPSWPWVVSLQGITLKTVLGVHKTYHACLFFNLSLALLSQTL
jgi:hypothetical protein